MNEPLSTVVEQGQQDDVRRKLMVSRAVRRWTCLFSLALSDVFAFAMSALIFRAGAVAVRVGMERSLYERPAIETGRVMMTRSRVLEPDSIGKTLSP